MFRKSVAVASLGLIGLMTGPTFAADLFVPQVIVQPELFSWTSCYVGVPLTWSTSPLDSNAPLSNYSTTPNGIGGGAQAGCDYQMPDSPLVVGIVVDAIASSSEESLAPVAGQELTGSIPFMGSIRGRIGVALDTTLLYATGGLAVARVENNLVVVGGALDATASNTYVGWTIGAGVEHMVTDNLSVFAEYDYADLGSKTNTFDGADFDGAGRNFLDISAVTHTVKVGLNYHF
ncbi:outer membrane immunogenic protein [Devosia sp. UYZn731]|uniref:outer membrane protein n=1 Tax=Devosia sp. UYZn731 TaxID=3156345 RepID=UPI0033958774